jgi:hypothetical protein
MNLKPQDILVVLKLVSSGSLPYGTLASQLGMSASEVHAAMKRAAGAGLVDITDPEKRRVRLHALYTFLIHGVPKAFPAKPGPIVRGTPTAHAAPPLSSIIARPDDLPPVWPNPDGKTRGYELRPLYKAVPGAAKRDSRLYELLALVDALRAGRARERNAAESELRQRILKPAGPPWLIGPFGITENDLDEWSGSYTGSESILPDLVRQLVFNLVPRESLIEARFPSHKAVNQAGFDGELKTRSPTAFANTEAAVWEISTSRDMRIKANRDYAVRTEDPLGWDKSATTYIALTGRIWREPGKSDWLRKKREEGEWADVRAYDAVDIAQWLAQAPVVQARFCSAIGRPLDDLDTVDDFAERWSERTAPYLNEKVVLSARDNQRDEVWRWLKGHPQAFFAGADTIEESVLFLCAAIRAVDEPREADWSSRTLIVRSEKAWRQAIKTTVAPSIVPLILVPAFPEFDGVLSGTEPHYLFVPIEKRPGPPIRAPHIELGPINRESLADSLREFMPDSDKARKLAYDCGGKLPVLQRLMGYRPPVPDWVENEDPDLLGALLLAGAWRPGNSADADILVRLSGGVEYRDIDKLVTKLANVPDPPLRRQGQVIKWRSNVDAWRLLVCTLSDSAAKRFKDICIETLGRASPRFDLPPEERVYASIRNAILPESEEIRIGLAESLVYLRMNVGNVSPVIKKPDVIRIVDDIVQEVLSGDWKVYATLGQQLPALAEASPSRFLTAVDSTMDHPSGKFEKLFQQDGRMAAPFRECCHAGLLWALEGLAWHQDYFARVAHILARLHRIDQGRQYLNRPMESLRSLFHPSVKQTACSNAQRLKVLQALVDRDRPAAWMIVSHVLKIWSRGSSVSANYRPRFNDWDLPEPLAHYSLKEILGFLEQIRQLAGGLIPDEFDRVLELFEAGGATVVLGDLFSYLESHALELKKREASKLALLQNLLRKWISRQYAGEAERQAPQEQTERAKQLIEALDTGEGVDRFVWLFAWHVVLPEPPEKESGRRSRERRVQEKRSEALSQLLNGPDSLLRALELADIAEHAAAVGVALADLPGSEQYDEAIITGPLDQEGGRKEAARAFIDRRVRAMGEKGIEWLIAMATRLVRENRAPAAVSVLTAAPSSVEVRDWVDSQSMEVGNDYWSRVSLWMPEVRDDADFERTVNRILAAHRWDEAIDLADWALGQKKPFGKPADYLRILEHPIVGCSVEEVERGFNGRSASHAIPEVFNHLDRCDDVSNAILAQLEVYYLEVLVRSERSELHVMHELGRKPLFFSELISMAFRRASAGVDETDLPGEKNKERERKAQTAYKLLRAWKGYPGKRLSPKKRDVYLKQWCDKALDLVKASDREVIGQQQIGEVLCRVPSCEDDGVWPCRVARELIEDGFVEIGNGLDVARSNARGCTFRSLDGGGDQERGIADGYQADADGIRDAYSRTAALLERMARSYLLQAEDQDNRAEKFTDP